MTSSHSPAMAALARIETDLEVHNIVQPLLLDMAPETRPSESEYRAGTNGFDTRNNM